MYFDEPVSNRKGKKEAIFLSKTAKIKCIFRSYDNIKLK